MPREFFDPQIIKIKEIVIGKIRAKDKILNMMPIILEPQRD
jgi:hypothetical protein